MKRWTCLRCGSVHKGEDTKVVLYLTQADTGYEPLFWICRECDKCLSLNEGNINCKIVLQKNNQITKELRLKSSSKDFCSICNKPYNTEEYGICIYKEHIKESLTEVEDAVQIINICRGCFKEINTFVINKGSENFFFDLDSYCGALVKREIEDHKIVISYAFGKLHDDGDTRSIVGDAYSVNFEFYYEKR